MKKLLTLLSLIAVCVLAQAQDQSPGWISVAATDEAKFEAQQGSFEVRTNRSNEEIAVVTGRVILKTNNVELQKWYVRTANCDAKQGKIVVLTLSGDFKYDEDFIFGGGTVGSATAQFVCGVRKYVSEEARKKSL